MQNYLANALAKGIGTTRIHGKIRLFSVITFILISFQGRAEDSSAKAAPQSVEPPPSLRAAIVQRGDRLVRPALWGTEIVGADFAKEELAEMALEPVTVVVSDGGVLVGASKESNYKPKAHRTLKLRLVADSSPTGKSVVKAINGMLDKFLPKQVDLPPTKRQSKYPNTHGGHVAGIVGALNPEFGVSPLAVIENHQTWPNEFDSDFSFVTRILTESFEHLIRRPEETPILNMSHLIFNAPSVHKALNELMDTRDTICVAAAGNMGKLIPPEFQFEGIDRCVVVSSMGPTGAISHFSSFGSDIDVMAPGEDIISRGPGFIFGTEKLMYASGTSMAAPMVSGAFSIVKALLPTATSEQLQTIIFRTATDLGAEGKDIHSGHGLLNVLRATQVAKRIRHKLMASGQTIAEQLDDDHIEKTIDTRDLARKAMVERMKISLGVATKSTIDWIRKENLLYGDASGLMALGTIYTEMKILDYGYGLQFAALNRSDASVDSVTASKLGKVIGELELERFRRGQPFFSYFDKFANGDLLVGTYQELDVQAGLLFLPTFLRQACAFDQAKANDILSIFAMKNSIPLKPGEHKCDDTAIMIAAKP